MTTDPLARNVLLRWKLALRVQGDQAPGQRQRARQLTQPINKTKGIEKDIIKENAKSTPEGEDTVKPDRRDSPPKDVFSPSPRNMGVLDFAQSGDDLSKALDKQIPKDKGYDTVNNLSQYLIYTEGGGGSRPEGKKV